MDYNHTQTGYLMFCVLLIVVLFSVFALMQSGFDSTLIVILSIVIIVMLSFLTLNVKIDEKYLRIKFGYGIYAKKFLLNEISSVNTAKNKWYYGWGIRVWFWPYMRIYNVSGFDAIEIIMKNNKIYRIGTDEPEKLKGVIEKKVKKN